MNAEYFDINVLMKNLHSIDIDVHLSVLISHPSAWGGTWALVVKIEYWILKLQ